jgi:hypothetical protein
MHVIAALDEERQAKSVLAGKIVRPGTERDDDVARPERTRRRRDGPARARLRETVGVALLQPAAALHEERRVAFRQPLRVRRRQGIGEMSAAERGAADMGLERLERGTVEQNRRDPVRLQFRDFLMHRLLAARAAPDLDPAGLT